MSRPARRCPVCGKPVALDQQGRIGWHLDTRGRTVKHPRCAGWRQPPNNQTGTPMTTTTTDHNQPQPDPQQYPAPTCQYCLADPRYTPLATAGAGRRCPVCGSAYTGPRRDREYNVLVEAGLVANGD